MKIQSFRIVNCFGFHDSGEINLQSEHNFIYLLGRNSSGKSSVLNAIKYFEWGINLSEQQNFKNFNDSGTQSRLVATYGLEKSKLSEEQFKQDLIEAFTELDLSQEGMTSNPKLVT